MAGQPILRVELGEVVYPPYRSKKTLQTRYGVTGKHVLNGVSAQPLLDACRALKAAGEPDSTIVGIYRAGKDHPEMTCSVGVGARTRVDETRSTLFAKWTPRPLGTWHDKEAKL